MERSPQMTSEKKKFGELTKAEMPLFIDLYELTMAQGHLERGHNISSSFDLSFREMPEDRGYIIVAGLEDVVEYVESISFEEEALVFLQEMGFKESLCEYLADFRFTGDMRAVPEGSVVFQHEPIIEITAPIVEAQILETVLINQIGFQSLIATKAARIYDTVQEYGQGQSLIEFGARRAHGVEAGIKASRAAYIGGFEGTSNLAAGVMYGIPVMGTMAHSWMQSYKTEEEAFESFIETYGEESILLIDTYDTIVGAERVNAIVQSKGINIKGVRLDSGDLVSLSKRVKGITGDLGIYITSGLDEYKIDQFLQEGGIVTGFGVGGNLETSREIPVAEIVYKLVQTEENGKKTPSMKFSDGKRTYPGEKSILRIIKNGKYQRDILALRGEKLEGEEQLVDIYDNGKLVYELPKLKAIQENTIESIFSLPKSCKKIKNHDPYRVEISGGINALIETLL